MAVSRNIALLLFFLAFVVCRAVPNPEASKRIVDKPPSEEEHYGDNEAHNPDYDHDSFLGQDVAKEFDQLTPEESKAKLALIVDKIDEDKDGFVTKDELRDWIKYTQNRYIMRDVDRQWLSFNEEQKELLDWNAYKKATYSYIDETQADSEDDDTKTYREMMLRDKRRWQYADKDKDEKLSKEEFGHFLHPEEIEHMQDIVIVETIEDIDKDGDGKISLAEYIGDFYSGSEEDEPEWVKNERDTFTNYRDKDKDGFMDKEEIKDWILPSDYNHSETEAVHLVSESDENKDGKLTKEEILDNYDIFVGSQATDFGEALTKHDEF